MTLILLDGLDFAATEVDAGKPLKDWEATQVIIHEGADKFIRLLFNKYRHPFRKVRRYETLEYQKLRINVHQALAFIHAHRLSLEYFEEHVAGSYASAEFGESEKIVVGEVKAQIKLARKVIEDTDEADMEIFESHSMCAILLNRTALYIESLLSAGVLEEREANAFLEEIEEAIEQTHHCTEQVHPGHLSKGEKLHELSLAESRISGASSGNSGDDDAAK